MFSSASPKGAMAVARSTTVMPDCTVTVLASRSMASTRLYRSSLTSTPSVHAMSVKECPLPTTFTCSPRSRAWPTSWAISSSVRGETMRVGWQV